MKAYTISFLKQDRSIREMLYAKLTDLAEVFPEFFEKFTKGTGSPKTLKPGSEMVFDLEKMNFRIINHLTAIDEATPREVSTEIVRELLKDAA